MGDAKVKYIKLLKEAVRMFYAQDAAKLLRGADGRSACERCVVNCIARYLWCLIQQRGLAADVDVEYNLDCKSEGLKRLHVSMCTGDDCKGCWMHECLAGRVRYEEMNGDSLVYPDLIVHVRGIRITSRLSLRRNGRLVIVPAHIQMPRNGILPSSSILSARREKRVFALMAKRCLWS